MQLKEHVQCSECAQLCVLSEEKSENSLSCFPKN